MKILAIESSCDEFAAAIVEDGRFVLSEVVNSQIDIHKIYGGVVPEVAARSHLETALAVVDECLQGFAWDDIDAIAVTAHPGLIGSLMIGTLVARTLALLKKKPLYAVDHIEGHIYATFLADRADYLPDFSPHLFRSYEERSASDSLCDSIASLPPDSGLMTSQEMSRRHRERLQKTPQFPFLALVVSGGHTQIMLFRDHNDYEIIGKTRDDAVGEAFDKVAKILGLPYPGGPSIAKSAERGNSNAYNLPKPKVDGLDFSFSGLKTAVLRAVQREVGVDHTFPSASLSERLTASQRDNFAAVFQKTAVEILVDKIAEATRKYEAKSIVLAGGVAANQELRRALAEVFAVECSSEHPYEFLSIPPMQWCTDNAVMIGARAYFLTKENPPINPRELEIFPTK